MKKSRVAIAGMGGVGGAHLLTLTRLAITNFNIADFDDFDVHNPNRQAGAFMPFMGQSKIDTVARLARDINPEIDLRLFPQGIKPENVDEFLRDVDVYVDGLDFFALPARSRRDGHICFEAVAGARHPQGCTVGYALRRLPSKA